MVAIVERSAPHDMLGEAWDTDRDAPWSPPRSATRPALHVLAGGRGVRVTIAAATYRRRRLAALLFGAAVATVLALGVSSVVQAAGGGPFPAPARSLPAPAADPPAAAGPYVVQPGDTVWSIARRLDPGGDPRPLVDRIVARTGGAVLQPGQVLLLE